MAEKPIVILPDPKLRLVSEPIAAITDEVRALARDMFDSMYAANGIGLAAIQIGVPKRLVVCDLGKGPKAETEDEEKQREPDPQVFVNPEIVWRSDELNIYEEGCLSIPDYTEEVERPARVRFRYLTLDGEPREVEAEGLLSICIQHEVDHLDGKLFIDHLSRLKRDRVTRKFAKAAKRDAAGA
ncbi:MAG: peptide deformylase [Salinarimonadaceae bacterium]|nr:MAG: peptide deformylase [Salinarimonadaceae bacterium]